MTDSRKKYFLLIHVILLIIFVLPACQRITPTLEAPSSTPLQERLSETPVPSGTPTTPPTPSITPSFEPSPEATHTPTPTNTPELPNLSLTPLRQELSTITKNNLAQVELLAVWGNGAPRELALSGDGSLIALGTDLGTYLYDSFDFRFVTLLRNEHPVSAIASSPDNQMISVLEGMDRIMIYDQFQFEQITALSLSSQPLPESAITTLFFSPESDALILLVESTNEVTVFRWETGSWDLEDHFTMQNGLASFVNKSIGVWGAITEENLILHSLVTPEVSRSLPLPLNPNAVTEAVQINTGSSIIPSANGDFLLLNQGTTVSYWDILDNEIIYQLEDYPLKDISPCEGIPDPCLNQAGGFSFVCADDASLTDSPVQLLAITPDDQRMLISLDTNRTELRTTLSGEIIWEVDAAYTKAFFSLNDEFVLGLRPDGVLEKRDLLDGELLSILKLHPSRFFDLEFSPDANILAAGFNDGWIRVFSTQTGEMLGILEGSAHSLRFSPDGRLLAAGLEEGSVRIFELDRGRFFDLGTGHLDAVTGVVFAQDETHLATTSQDCTIHRWDLKDRYRTDSLTPGWGNPGPILDIEKSPNGEILFSAGAQAVFMIDGENMTQLFSAGEGESISDLALSQDGQHLAVGGSSVWFFTMDQSEWKKVPFPTSTTPGEGPFRVAFLSDDGLLLTVNEMALNFYSLEDNQPPTLLKQLPIPPSLAQPEAVIPSPHKDLIAIGSENGLLHIFGIKVDSD